VGAGADFRGGLAFGMTTGLVWEQDVIIIPIKGKQASEDILAMPLLTLFEERQFSNNHTLLRTTRSMPLARK